MQYEVTLLSRVAYDRGIAWIGWSCVDSGGMRPKELLNVVDNGEWGRADTWGSMRSWRDVQIF